MAFTQTRTIFIHRVREIPQLFEWQRPSGRDRDYIRETRF